MVLAGAPLAYFWLIGRYGWSDTDDGFVLASGWRVHLGQTPYLDFLDVRPPVSAWLHSLWFLVLPRELVFAGARFGAIVQVWTSSLIGTAAVLRAREGADERPSAMLPVALSGFLASAAAFTPMPWHTTDGVMFCAAGCALIVARRGALPAGLAGALLLLGLGTKQSFYPMAPLALAFLAVQRRWIEAGVMAAVMAAGVGLFAGWLAAHGALEAFLSQTSTRTGAGFIWTAGVDGYLRMGLGFAGLAGAVLAAVWLGAKALRRRLTPLMAALIVGALALGAYGLRMRDQQGWINASTLGFPHALFLAAAALAAWRASTPKSRTEGLASLLFLGLAWCSSLSIGFPTPLLFISPILAVLAPRAGVAPRWAMAAAAAAFAGLAALHPYEDLDGRSGAHCSLAHVEPTLAGIVSGPITCRKLAEYERFRRAFPGSFVTLPALAEGHALLGLPSPIAADWPTLAEDAGQSARLIGEADARVRWVLVERLQASAAAGDQLMPLYDHVRASWRPVATGEFYAVFENPRL